MKVKPVNNADKQVVGWRFNCPGCGSPHICYTTGPVQWSFNGNVDKPTFSPSVLVRREHGEERAPHVCHSFVDDGRIQFLSDCTHAMAGQTVDLPDLA